MKNVPIKFRGKPTLSSDYIYGDYVARQDGCAIRFRENENLFNMHVYEVAVKPESVAQLVGYDADGNEVYEDDEVYSEFFGRKHYYKIKSLISVIKADDGQTVFWSKIENYKLAGGRNERHTD